MQLFCVFIALLFYANLVHAHDVLDYYYGTSTDATNLSLSPVDSLDGYHCSDVSIYFADASKGLRESSACKEGDEGLVKHVEYLLAVMRKADLKKSNKPYMCCINMYTACGRLVSGYANDRIETVTEVADKGKKHEITSDCSTFKKCQDQQHYFCIQEAANVPGHYHYIDNATLMDLWTDLPVCCRKQKIDKTCDYEKSEYKSEAHPGNCERFFGRCGNYNGEKKFSLCSKKKVDTTGMSCCIPNDSELCPFNISAIALKSPTTGHWDWVAANFGDDLSAWNKACLNLSSSNPNFTGATYIYNDKCCAKLKLDEVTYYGSIELLSDKYERLSTTPCQNDKDCGNDGSQFCANASSSDAPEWYIMGKACFEKIQCPHKTATVYPVLSLDHMMTCDDSSTCPKDTTCLWGKPAPATEAKVKKPFGMCCPEAPDDNSSTSSSV